jgi:hypothetical protein
MAEPPPTPEEPHESGVPETVPDRERIEGARVLADQAAEQLRPSGFTNEEIRLWAETYLSVHSSGDVRDFIAWIAERERDAESG